MESAAEEPYHEMKRHLPILWTVIKYLPVRDLHNGRLIDHYWKDATDDAFYHQEMNGESPLKPITFSGSQIFEHFQAAFPARAPTPNGFPIFHFGNLELRLGGTSPIIVRPAAYYPYLKIATIAIPYSTRVAFQYLWDFLNKCPVLQKLSLKNCWGDTLPQLLERVELATLPSLKIIDIDWSSNWDYRFLEHLVHSAPKLKLTSVRYDDKIVIPSQIPAMLKQLESVQFDKLDLQLIRLPSNYQKLFNDLGRMNLRVRELSLDLVRSEQNQENANLISDWLAKLGNNGLQKLSLDSWDFRVRLPAVLNIQSLKVNAELEKPLEPGQVPNLEDITIGGGYPQTPNSGDLTHPHPHPVFPAGKLFPTVKKLQLELRCGYQNFQLELGFPNLESLKLINAFPESMTEGVTTMRKLLQLSNLVRLILEFTVVPRAHDERVRDKEAWWDLFTGGILPRMDFYTKLEVVYGTNHPIDRVDQEGILTTSVPTLSVFELMPNLKRLELLDRCSERTYYMHTCPETLVYAIMHLTATEKIPHLETLRFGHVGGLHPFRKHFPGIKHFLPMLKAYHNSVILI